MIKNCKNPKCDNKFQDSRYGKNRRVHNKTSQGKYRCTVCLHERE